MPLSAADATARAEAEVRAYCRWHVTPVRTDDSVTLDGPGSHALVLPSLKVTAVTSITEDGTLVPDTDYQWSASGVVRRTTSAGDSYAWGPHWTAKLRGLVVVFTHGYTTWPLDVLTVVEQLANRAVESSAGTGMLTQVGAVAYATGEDGLPLSAHLTPLDRRILDRYRLPVLP